MSYNSFETSSESGKPVEVFEFSVGSTVYPFTTAEDVVTLGATDYEPAKGMRRGSVETSLQRKDSTFEITVPATNAVAQLFANIPPGQKVQVVAKRFHRGDSEVVIFFEGEVQSVSWRKDLTEAVIVSLPSVGIATHTTPRFTFQGPCNHVLYDPNTCKVDDTDPAFRAASYAVSDQVGRVLTVPGLSSAYAAGWFIGGFVEIVGGADFRMVLDQDGDDLELLLPFSTTPTLVNVFAGCAHDPDSTHGCGPKFNNGDNYGGFFYVPTKNPFDTGI